MTVRCNRPWVGRLVIALNEIEHRCSRLREDVARESYDLGNAECELNNIAAAASECLDRIWPQEKTDG